MRAVAQFCTPQFTLNRFNGQSNVMNLSWTPPPGSTSATRFEIVQQTKSDYCTETLDPEVVVGTTASLSFTYTVTTPGVVEVVFVRLASDHCVRSNVVLGDTFTTPPSKPPKPAVSSTGVMSVSYSDFHTSTIQFQRSLVTTPPNFQTVARVDPCGPDPKTAIDNTATPGVYQYQVFVTNAAGFGLSPAVTALIGNAVPLKIDSFTAIPSTILEGQATSIATLAWKTEGATSVSIDPATPALQLPVSGSVPVKPRTDTTYTLTATQGSNSVTAQVTVHVISTAFVNITKILEPILEVAGTGGASRTYGLTNSGGQPTTVTLTQEGAVVSQSPSTFSLEPGATQIVTVTATAQPAGTYVVPVTISYLASPAAPGPNTINFKYRVFSTSPPPGPVSADASQVRVDVTGAPGTNPTGTVTFKNNGTATLTGVLSTDVAWIVVDSGQVTIPPQQAGTFNFTIDRSQRPDASSPAGSLAGHLKLAFLKPATGSAFAAKPLDNTPAVPSVSIVKVVDTVSNAVTAAGVPSLAPGEVALYVAGVGHTTNAAGTAYVSDVSMLNTQGGNTVGDLKMYYTSAAGAPPQSKSTSVPPLAAQASVALADVVKSVFSGANDLGTLHIRSKDADKLAIAASVLSTNNAAGTLGNAIPVLRSDRSAATGNALMLTGLRKDANTATDLYIQETAGAPANVQIDFLAADGSTISSIPAQAFDAFRMKQLKDAVPANAVAAIVTNTSGTGKISGYATMTDSTSGDTWAAADWSTQLGYTASEPVVIPIAGSVHGANSTFYRSEVDIMNRGTSPAAGTLTFIGRDGTRSDHAISLGGHQSQVMSDIIANVFAITKDATGYLIFTPSAGSNVAVTSRTFATVGASTRIVSTGIPVVAAASALTAGATRQIAGFGDAERTTVLNGTAGTFRTNFALMETAGKPVTVRVTFHFTFPAGDKVQGAGGASRDYPMNGNQFMLLNSIAGEILGSARLQYGDLQNVTAEFQVLSGEGGVIVFTSSVDNASGDATLRTE